MFFDKKDKIANEKTIYTSRPSMILGCKKAIFGIILLIVVLSISSPIITFIGEMQVYLISYVKVGLTRYSAIALFVIILLIILYIIWQLLSWYSVKYTLTDKRIITQRGLLNTKKSYMPYSNIQDINSSQSIIGRLMGVGSVTAFSAYDNSHVELKDIRNPDKVEDIIFSRMHNNLSSRHYSEDVIVPDSRRYEESKRGFDDDMNLFESGRYEEDVIIPDHRRRDDFQSAGRSRYEEDIIVPEHRSYDDSDMGFEDDFIVPEHRRHDDSKNYESRQNRHKREPYYNEYFIRDEESQRTSQKRRRDAHRYDYYPEKDYQKESRPKYEYEPSYQRDDLEHSINSAINRKSSDFKFEGYSQFNQKRKDPPQEDYAEEYYDEPSELYYNDPDEFYNEPDEFYNEPDEFYQEEDETFTEDNSSSNAIERHFRKFKK